jgi:chitinase
MTLQPYKANYADFMENISILKGKGEVVLFTGPVWPRGFQEV